MFNIQKLKSRPAEQSKSIDLRQKLLQKEFESLKHIPQCCQIQFDNPDVLYAFKLIITPDKDSYWHGGQFEFEINVPESYNFEVCWHFLKSFQSQLSHFLT
jgi:ubiquitin-protein ligase